MGYKSLNYKKKVAVTKNKAAIYDSHIVGYKSLNYKKKVAVTKNKAAIYDSHIVGYKSLTQLQEKCCRYKK